MEAGAGPASRTNQVVRAPLELCSEKDLRRLDLITTVLAGRPEVSTVVPTISPPFTGETRTIRPPAPGTLTSFTGTILAPGRRGSWVRTVIPVGPNVVTLTELTGRGYDGRCTGSPILPTVTRPGGRSETRSKLTLRSIV